MFKKFVIGATVLATVVLSSATRAEASWFLAWSVHHLHSHHADRAGHGCWGSYARRWVRNIHRHCQDHRADFHHWGHGFARSGGYLGSTPYSENPYYTGQYEYVVPSDVAPEGKSEGDLVEPPPISPEDSTIRLDLNVPEDASVFINGQETTSTGGMRFYVSRNLMRDTVYTYLIRTEVVRGGKSLSQTRSVQLQAGNSESLSFEFPQASPALVASQLITSLVLHVPNDAKVTLAGLETESSGEKREFTTTLLSDSSWVGYAIRVEIQRDGRSLVQERTVNLRPGDRRELKFDFHSNQVASIR